MTRATLVIYQSNGDEPVVVEFDVVEDDKEATIVISRDDVKINTKDEPRVIPVASCPKHFASALDVQGGTDPESWWFKCRTNGETYTYAEIQKESDGQVPD